MTSVTDTRTFARARRPAYAESRPLFERYATSRERSLRNHLVEQYAHIADIHARRYARNGPSRDDLQQVAMLGLLYAVERFDPTMGHSFATFAARTVDGECKRFLRDRTWLVKPPRSQQELYLAARAAEAELGHELRRSPTLAELAVRVDASEDQVLEALDAGNARHGEELGHGPAEMAASTERLGPYDAVDMRMTLDGVVDRLGERDRRIVALRFTHGWTETRIAAELGVSQSYLSRRLRRILRDLRQMLDVDAS